MVVRGRIMGKGGEEGPRGVEENRMGTGWNGTGRLKREGSEGGGAERFFRSLCD